MVIKVIMKLLDLVIYAAIILRWCFFVEAKYAWAEGDMY
jgi:hypothetical protein